MVGVPGRSKGCNTCRKRRIGCSLERPQCAQCIRSKLVCAGYQRERIFVTGPKIISQALQIKQSDEQPAKPVKDVIRVPANSEDEKCLAGRDTGVVLHSLPPSVPPYAAFREMLLEEFICNWIPDTDRVVHRRLSKNERFWMMLLPELATNTKALESSSLALCTARLGRLNGNQQLVQESMKLYGQALWELQKALWNPDLMYRDETLAACILLSVYEVAECPALTRSAWVTHSDGCARLIQLRGPSSYSSSLGHQLFLTARFSLTMQALSLRCSTFLSEPEWTSVPWKTSSKTVFDRLLDLLMQATHLYEQAYVLGESIRSPSSFSALLEIISQCWDIDSELRHLHLELEKKTAGPAYWPEFSREASPADDAALGKLFPVAFHFQHLRLAHTYMLYWTLTIMLWSGLGFLYLDLATIPPDQLQGAHASALAALQLPPLEHRTDIMPMVRNICQSLEYCMQEKMRAMGPLAASFPLQVVIDNLKDRDRSGSSRELVWAQAMMERIRMSGFRISMTS